MIKVLCIEYYKHKYTKREVKKGIVYFTYPNYFYNKWDVIPIFEKEDSDYLLSTFYKKYFITLDEWRNQQIDKILK